MSDDLELRGYPIDEELVPEGWVVTNFGSVASDIQPGFACGNHNSEGRGVVHLRPMNISTDGELVLKDVRFVEANVPNWLESGDVLFNNTNSSDLVGKTAYSSSDAKYAFSNHMTRVRVTSAAEAPFVAAQLQYLFKHGYFKVNCNNHVSQASISSTYLRDRLPFVVPPVPEQRRIVAKIEALQARSRKAREALEAIPPLLEQFRQSVLAAAFRGDLTADWREQHSDVEPASVLLERIRAELTVSRKRGKVSRAAVAESESVDHDEGTIPETWQAVRLRDVLTLQPGFAFSSKDFKPEGIRLLRGTNIVPNGTRWDETVCLPANKAQMFGDYKLQKGDIVFAMDRPIISTGIKVARIADSDLPALLLQRVGRFRLSSCIEPGFLYAYLQSNLFRQHIDTRETGTQLPHVSGNDIEAAPFILPPLSEQVEISRILDSATQRAEVIYQSVQQGISDLDALDQSILAKAFRGELVPQDPNDEPASVLLERIQAERADDTNGKPPRGRRKRSSTGADD